MLPLEQSSNFRSLNEPLARKKTSPSVIDVKLRNWIKNEWKTSAYAIVEKTIIQDCPCNRCVRRLPIGWSKVVGVEIEKLKTSRPLRNIRHTTRTEWISQWPWIVDRECAAGSGGCERKTKARAINYSFEARAASARSYIREWKYCLVVLFGKKLKK